jgi:very-short-patch-repair endonuclease
MHPDDTPEVLRGRAFSRAEALEAGITDRQLRGPRFRRLLFDLHVDADVDVTAHLRAAAALGQFDGVGHASHHTAAKLWDAWVPDDPNVHISVFERSQRRQGRGLRSHLAHPTVEVVTRKGIRTSSPAQTFLEMATRLDLVDLVVLGDSLVHRGHVTPDELVRAAGRWRGRQARLARRAARYVRSGVESPMESRARMMLVLYGLSEPVVNVTVRIEGSGRRYRLDLSWPHLRIAVEYEGRQHLTDPDQWRSDLRRREELEAAGWILIMITAEDLYAVPGDTMVRVVAALERRGVRAPSAVDDEWARHFPGRSRAA